MGEPTLRLAVDNVSELPVGNLRDIPAELRELANTVERGEAGDVESCIFLVVREGGISIYVRGESCSAYELMGLFEAAKLRVFADDAVEDDG
jgi:hypothetical protein